jgi:23S rRNA (pseudouridine1915-N3)-methyltransferase
LKIRILWPGKTKKDYYRSAIQDYAGRIRKFVPLEIIEIREGSYTDRQRSNRIRSESKELTRQKQSGTTVLLDTQGKMLSSMEFSNWLQTITGSIDFILGGPEGSEPAGVSMRLSLGQMTLPHELARVVLLEQLYRALTIQHNHPYHK